MRSRITPAFLILLAALPAAGRAQGSQYAAPGSLAVIEQSRAEQAREKAERARWTLGRLRIAPDLALQDIAWVSNVYDAADGEERSVSDFTATARAGLEVYSHLGPDVLLSIFGNPSYTYWNDEDQLRQGHLSYGAGLFGLHNRLTWELSGEHDERQSFATNEIRAPLDLENNRLTAQVSVDFWGPLGIFARVDELEAAYPDRTPDGATEADLAALDHSESIVAGGLYYEPGETLRVGLGVQTSQVDFDVDPGGRSNESTSPFLTVRVPGNRADFDLFAVHKRLEFDNPDLAARDELTGRGRATWELGSRTDLALFAGRNVVYSALDDSAYFASNLYGGQLAWGRRREQESVRLALLLEAGSDRFTNGTGDLSGRRDDVLDYGVTLSVPYRRLVTFQIGVIQSEVDSNVDEFDRSYTRIRTTVRLQPLRPLD